MAGPPTHQLPVLSEHATEVLINAARIKAQEIGIGTHDAHISSPIISSGA